MEKFSINSKYGVFEVVANDGNKGFSDLYYGDYKVATVKADWWNEDALINEIENNKEQILGKMSSRGVEVCQNNLSDVIAKAAEIVKEMDDNAIRGFVGSRLTQCINKLKVA